MKASETHIANSILIVTFLRSGGTENLSIFAVTLWLLTFSLLTVGIHRINHEYISCLMMNLHPFEMAE
jgi:hypothetical protein